MNELIEYLKKIPNEYWPDILSILENLEKDPCILYHEYSKIYCRYRWPRHYYLYSRPGLIKKMSGKKIDLPKPNDDLLDKPLHIILRERRSIRNFKNESLSLTQLSTILYYSFGVKGYKWGYPMRMFPSAGALQPVEAYILSRNIDDLEHGIYHYEADKHLLTLIRSGDFSHELYRFSLEQDHVREAAFNIILTMVYPRTASKYGYRSYRYALLDIGHVGMNIYLVATAMNLGTCAVGAFEDDKVGSLLQLDGRNEFPILIYPIGVPR